MKGVARFLIETCGRCLRPGTVLHTVSGYGGTDIGRANQYVTEVAEYEEYQEHEVDDLDESQLRSSQPPRAKKRRLKSLESKHFQGVLTKGKELHGKLSLIEMIKDPSKFTIKQSHTIRNVEISLEEVMCNCSQSQQESRKTCHHIVWLFLNLFDISENDQLVAQTKIGALSFLRLANAMPAEIPTLLKTQRDADRRFSQKLKEHSKFSTSQTWYLSRKRTTKPARCSGCLKPRTIVTGYLHLYVDGLLYLEKDDRVVETKLRFCISSSCVRDIKSSLNNIRSIESDTVIQIDSALNGVTQAELNTIKANSIKVANLENVQILP